MADCTGCEVSFSGNWPLEISLMKWGSKILVYARNNSPNIIIIKRLLVCRQWSSGGRTVNYLREGDFIVGGERVEQGSSQLKWEASAANVVSAEAQAEYIEITGRSRSCELKLS